MNNPCIDAAVIELEAVGIKPTIENGGKHIKVVWSHNGQERKYVTGNTPSDRRAPLNVRSEVRRMLRLDGLLKEETLPAERPAITIREGIASVSSLDIARHFGKAHKDVLRAVDGLIAETGPEFGGRNFTPSSYLSEQSKELRSFDLSRDGFALLVMGFTGTAATRWKMLYIEAFNIMEAELVSARAPLERRLDVIEGDLAALTQLFMSECKPPQIIRSAGFIRIKPSIQKKWLETA